MASRVHLGVTPSSMSFHDEEIMMDFGFVTAKYVYSSGCIHTYVYMHTYTQLIYTHKVSVYV
jgi:hypothetical protein